MSGDNHRDRTEGSIRFGDFEFDRDREILSRSGVIVPAEPKVLALIRFLLDHHGRIVSKDEIMTAVWPDAATTPSSLSRAVSLARAALSDRHRDDKDGIIETIRGKGYRIAVPLTFVELEDVLAPPSRFIGRHTIVQTLSAWVEELAAGTGGLTLVSGEAGIGKTRLAEEIARAARARGIEVLWGRCREDGEGPAYGPWTELLRSHAAHCGIERVRTNAGADCDALSDVLPELSPDREFSGHVGSSAAARSLQLAAAERLFVKASQFRSLLLILEDVHSADEASHFLLQHLAELATQQPIGFLVTYRGDEMTQSAEAVETLVKLAREVPERVEVNLGGLTREETRAFVHDRIDVEWNDDEVGRLHARSDGNPFFLQELIRHRTEGMNRKLPETLRLLIQSRFEGIGRSVHEVLRMASVIGREFRSVDLAHALGKNESEIVSWLGEAEDRRLVEATVRAGNEFRFTHALVREALYDTLRSDEKRALHGRIGSTFAALYGNIDRPPLDDLARHFAEAGLGDRAIRYSIAAAAHARQHLAFESAAASLKRALRVLAAMPPVDQKQECELLLELGDVMYRSGRTLEGTETIKRAIEIARHVGAVDVFAQGACTLALWRDDNIGIVPTERLSLLEEALRSLPTEDSAVRARVLTGLSADLYWSDDFERSAALSREAVDVARRVRDPATTFVALYQRYDLLFGPQHGAEIDRINAEVLTLAKQLGDIEYEFYARGRIYERHLAKAEPFQIDQSLDACARIADRLRQPRFNTVVERMRSARELWRGDLEAASARLPEPAEAAVEGTSAIRSIALIPHMFLVLRMQGRLSELEPLARAGVERFPNLFALRCALGLFLALTNRTVEAKTLLGELARDDFAGLRMDVNHAINLAVLSETVALVEDREIARTLLHRIEPYAGSHMVTGVFMSLGSADRYLGLLATTLGRFDDAVRHFEAALAIETRMGAAPWIVWGERDYARMLIKRDRGQVSAEAKQHLDHADRIEAQILEGRL